MSEHIHPLVVATIEEHRARRELELERLRSARNACTTASPGGQSRALALGKKIREVEEIVTGWRLAVATLIVSLDAMGDSAEEATEPFSDMSAIIAEAKETTDADRVVGSQMAVYGTIRCFPCTLKAREQFPWTADHIQDVTSEDLPDGGVCADCHADVLA